MALVELLAAVPPPATPKHNGSEAVKALTTAGLVLPLPGDLVAFAARYGSGMFSDTLIIHNPFDPDYTSQVEEVSRCYRELKQAEGDAVIPYRVYPDRPGLLLCGSEVNGGMIFWLTEGEPDQWPLVLMTCDFQFERRDESLTSFLAQVFSGRTGCVLWDLRWVQANLVGAAFHGDSD